MNSRQKGGFTMSGSNLKFLGTGSCFNTKFGNTSAYYYYSDNKHLFLIDCGETVFSSIRYSEMLLEAESVDILITHLHSDHAGSLESLIFFCHYYKNIIPTVIFPDVYEMSSYLKRVPQNFYNLLTPNQYEKFNICYFCQHHIVGVESYGYLMNINGKNIFYSGDSKTINPKVLHLLMNGNIDYFYQDVTRFNIDPHMNVNDLANIIPPEKRKFVTCMHFDDNETLEMARDLGFKVAKRSYPKKL